ncbi:MAG: sigma-70 family RNA polymerase sigma factor [Acidimicrobiales bacterium]
MGSRTRRLGPLRLVDQTDESFVRALWDEHAGALLAYATRLTGDRGRAEDILQEAMVRAWRHAEQLETDGRSLRPWLFTVVSHLAMDAARASRARPREVGGTLPERPVEDSIDSTLRAREVAEALATLSPAHRAALVETYYRGRSVAEAARELGVPPGTVKSRTYYGLHALRLALTERGWTP